MINTLLKRRMENTKKNKKGFTLVELIVVLVIIAILAAVLVPTVSGYIGRAKKTSAQASLKSVVTAAQSAGTDLIGQYDSVTTAKATSGFNFATLMSDNSGDKNITKGVGIIVLDDATGTVVYATFSDGTYYATYTAGTYATGKGKKVSELKTNGHTAETGSTDVEVYTASTTN